MKDLNEALTELRTTMRTLGLYMHNKGLESTESMTHWPSVQYVLVMLPRIKEEERTPERLKDLASTLLSSESGIVEEILTVLGGERGVVLEFEHNAINQLKAAMSDLHTAMVTPSARATPGM